ncbi:MAG: hypothetical protein LUE27_00985 [Clostridia bacterium]|nr:hypothetical protein [Clostridia bacterium]
MGSGEITVYDNKTGSQVYADKYHVVPSEIMKDKAVPEIYDAKAGYFHNPSAINLEDAIKNDKVYIEGECRDYAIYVLDTQGNIIVGIRDNPNKEGERAPHPTLIGGKHVHVQCAGILHFSSGKISSFNNKSGHFRPDEKSLIKVISVMDKIKAEHPGVFAYSYDRWRDNLWRKLNK